MLSGSVIRPSWAASMVTRSGPGHSGGAPVDRSPFDQTYGRAPIPLLTPDDLAALGEVVTRQFSVLSARSAIPVLCGTPTGQPGSTSAATDAPPTVFSVQGERSPS